MSVVSVPVGNDAFRAQMISDVCTDEGIRNELVLSEDHHSILLRRDHYLIVAEDEVGHVGDVINDHFPEMIHGDPVVPAGHGDDAKPRSSTPLWQRVVLVGGIVAPVIAALTPWLRDLFS